MESGRCRSQIEGNSPHTSARPMTIIIDPPVSTAKGQGPRPPSPPPSHPPPSYNESTSTQPLVVHPGVSGVPPARAGYGPTPIGQQQQAALPYYDPRSPHSVQAAKRRARGRFIGAALWVVVIYALLSVLVWMDVRIQLGWSVSSVLLLRTEPHRTLPFPRPCMPLQAYYLLHRATYICTLMANVFCISWKGDVRFIIRRRLQKRIVPTKSP